MLKVSVKLLRIEKLTRINHERLTCNIISRSQINSRRNTSTGSSNEQPNVTFDQVMTNRKLEAEKSIVVQVQSENSYNDLFNYCSQFGKIKKAFHYKTPQEQNNFILLEFDEVSQYKDALEHSRPNDESGPTPVVSPFLWFKAVNTRKARSKDNTSSDCPALQSEETNLIADDTLKDLMNAASTIDDQIEVLFGSTCLGELGTRTRFIAAKQLETALAGMFPNVQAFPFGSSVNGFGKVGCDLDLILRLQPDNLKTSAESRLVFHTKTSLSNPRSQTQRQMELLGDILHLFLPGTVNVRRILNARVPIIKYNHEHLNLDVDLSMTNLTGLYMSELLYIYGKIDERVRPLTFCVRKWANSTGLTNTSPGRWITNFPLTLLVLFFLQCLKNPVIPSMNHLIASATKDDIRITDNNVHCTFIRDLKNLNFQTKNKDQLSQLLIQFFEFYSQFDFHDKSVCLVEGKPVSKMDHAALWIVNPFEPLMNVSKNVSFEELERFKFEAKNAAWVLESTLEKSSSDTWGLLNLFKFNRKTLVKPEMFFKSRLVEVSDIFEDSKQKEIHFRNNGSRSEVESIRQATKKVISKFDLRKSKLKSR